MVEGREGADEVIFLVYYGLQPTGIGMEVSRIQEGLAPMLRELGLLQVKD